MNNVPHRPKSVPGPLQTDLLILPLNHLKADPAARNQFTDMEPTIGIEPMTSSLPRKCSTTELRGHFNVNDSPIPRSNRVVPLEREKGLEPSTLSLEG